jgi:exodeoxyribonuclease VII small subunit
MPNPPFYPVRCVRSTHAPNFLIECCEKVHPVAIDVEGQCPRDYNSFLPEPDPMDRTEPLTPDDAPASFEDAQAELDELVRAMETGQMPLDGLLSAYKRGAQLLEFCRSRLDAVEEQVKVLEEGQLKPWTRP